MAVTVAHSLQQACSFFVLGCYIHYIATQSEDALDSFIRFLFVPVAYILLHYLWYKIDVHKRWGFWKCTEPPSHLRFSIVSSWIVVLFSIGQLSRRFYYHMAPPEGAPLYDPITGIKSVIFYEFPDRYKLVRCETLTDDIVAGIVVFYAIDFLRYWAHRTGHYSFFFKTFPFAHAHHHNQIFVNPLTTLMSPLLHLASLATYTPPFICGAMGNQRAAAIGLAICFFPNWTQHLGFDPFPWLTRINHYYFCGALPWIPLYHSYHHNPFIKTGNFGNTTVLFDYVFGTLQPESIYHIEHGRPMEKVDEMFRDEKRLDRILKSMYESAGGKNRIDLNEKGYDFSKEMLSMDVL